MSNKTALQEILFKLKEHEHLYGNMYPQFESWLKEGLEKEITQIMEAYNEGYSESTEEVPMTPYEYYDYNYGNPQGDPEETE
ncbi:hypothetical protein [Elizabethkingia ursingii]|uniref:hypothetical protein n=1 Tax=Elizabethkingia ursingii TaxID=1756150 RepID=UPI0020114568|nr:hypothetical protein [Elizabethkingia ursingii]MCL1671734.1 hypothetical protein [Elizabethkingia ursingii]